MKSKPLLGLALCIIIIVKNDFVLISKVCTDKALYINHGMIWELGDLCKACILASGFHSSLLWCNVSLLLETQRHMLWIQMSVNESSSPNLGIFPINKAFSFQVKYNTIHVRYLSHCLRFQKIKLEKNTFCMVQSKLYEAICTFWVALSVLSSRRLWQHSTWSFNFSRPCVHRSLHP